MLVTPTGLQTAPGTLSGPTAQPSPVAAAPAEVLISTQQVLFGTAAVQATRRAPLAGRIATALRRMVADANHPRHPHYPAHCAYIEDARMAREMDRL
ncbi:hypothetical protein ACRU43_09710 [Mycobacterium colombiense]